MKVPHAFYIAVGSELAAGRRVETNAERLAHWLEALGCEIRARCLVADDEAAIASVVRLALDSRAELVVVSGGLGPTADDVTRQGIAAALGAPLELDHDALARIEQRYIERGREVPEGARRMAARPAGAEGIANPIGTAPGFLVRRGGSLLVALPGVPREFEVMVERTVLPELKQVFAALSSSRSAILHVVGLPEAEVDRLVSGALEPGENLHVSLLAQRAEVELMLVARAHAGDEAEELLDRAVVAVRDRLGDHVYGTGGETLVGVVGRLLEERGWMLGVAESLSGGLLAKRITDVPGSSRFFAGGLAAYSVELKRNVLGVPADVLDSCGPVSAETARAMALGAREVLGAEVVAATTGIAGPAGGTTEKPVGLVYLAVAWPGGLRVLRQLFTGNRVVIRSWTAATALDEVRRALAGLPPLGQPVDDADGGCR